MVSGTRCAHVSKWMCDVERGNDPKGADDLCLICLEALSWDLNLNAGIWASTPYLDLSLEAGIWASRLDLILKDVIGAKMLGYEPCV